MSTLTWIFLLVACAAVLNAFEQRRRIALLGRVLQGYQVERLMQQLTEGYLRWLDEQDPERRAPLWNMLLGTERSLASQMASFARDFAGAVTAPQAQVNTLPFSMPYAQQLLPRSRLFDARRVFELHARGVQAAIDNPAQLKDKDRAYMMTAELLLFQHSCHWFCRSRSVADARLLARHGTPWRQVVGSVSEETRGDYLALVGRR